MKIITREFTFNARSGEGKIFTRLFEPAERAQAKAVVQIAHGMAEHSLRYCAFSEYLAEHGFVVSVHDHMGHGESVKNGSAYGYFGTGGYTNLVDDMHTLHNLLSEEYPSLPYIMMGHSMGSFLTRSYLSRFGEGIAAGIICGTSAGQGNLVMAAGKKLADQIVRKQGEKSRSDRLEKLTTGAFNKKFEPSRTQSDWLTRDEKIVDAYCKDPLCGFPFTAAGYRDLIYLLSDVNRKECFSSVLDIPLLIISGAEDPVGNFGKGVRKVAERFEKSGHRKLQLILYPECRHELLNELNREEIYEDIKNFLEKEALPQAAL